MQGKNKTKQEIERIWQFDYLKALAIIFVIMTHLLSYNNISPPYIVGPYIINMAVPVFMIVSGYVNAQSCLKIDKGGIKEFYYPKRIISKYKNIYIPFAIFYIMEIILMRIKQGRIINIKEAIYVLITGGWGPGSYYIPILAQMILIFPIMYYVIKKHRVWGSIAVLGIQLMLEVLLQYNSISEKVYRLLVIRYIAFLWFGIILFYYRDKIRKEIYLLSGIIGAVYIYIITYAGYQPILFPYWTETSMPTALWIGSIFVLFLQYAKPLHGVWNELGKTIGNSTFYIFLAQMMYFQLGFGTLTSIFAVDVVIAIIICCVVGMVGKRLQGLRKTQKMLK